MTTQLSTGLLESLPSLEVGLMNNNLIDICTVANDSKFNH